MDLPNYEELRHALMPVALDRRVSEWHGYICGVLAVDITFPLASSVSTLVADSAEISMTLESDQLMQRVYQVAQSQMTDTNLQFQLILPDSDNMDLNTRVNALASWCEGFLFGLANAGLQQTPSLHPDIQEILVDFSRIAQLDGADTGAEDDEVFYNELMEFVRMSVLLVAEEIQPLKSSEGIH